MWEVELSWRAAIALRGVGRVARTVIRQTRRFRLADALQALGAKAQQLSLFSDGDAPAPSALAEDAVPLPSIDQVIRDLATKQVRLSNYIEQRLSKADDVGALSRLFALHGTNASRLGRLLRDRLALTGEGGDVVAESIAQALEEIECDLEAQG